MKGYGMDDDERSMAYRTRLFVRQALIAIGLVVLALFLWHIAYALLLAFAAVLFAVFLRGVARKLSALSGLGSRMSLAIVGVLLVALVIAAGVFVGPSIAGQLGQLGDTITNAVSQLRSYIEQSEWGRQIVQRAAQGMQQGGSILSRLASLLTGFVDGLLALLVVLFAGAYFAFAPHQYVEGLVKLFPPRYQERGRDVLETTGHALWRWLLGQFVVMVVVGALTTAGLFLIGVPLALALGLIAGLLEFVPFLGPIAAAVPVLLVALSVDGQTALYAALLFIGIQQVESNLLEPLVQREAVSLPPVLILFSAIAFALIFGLLGAILATPLLLVVIVSVKMLYMHDALGQDVEVPGKAQKASRQ